MFARRCVHGRNRSQPSATVRNRPQPSAAARARSIWPCLWGVLQRWSFLAVSDVSLLRFAWQAWHFVTVRRVLERVESRFAWQAQYFCDVFRRCVASFRGRRSTLDVSIVIFRGRRSTLDAVSSRVSGFPVASPCLWGKLQNVSFRHVANCENCRKSRTKCWFFCIHVSCLESLVFLWRRRVYGGSWKTSPIRMCPSRLSCRFAWQAWHFVTFQPV